MGKTEGMTEVAKNLLNMGFEENNKMFLPPNEFSKVCPEDNQQPLASSLSGCSSGIINTVVHL